ncbi:MAG: hypothetical protein PHP03_03545 [Candidatus Pacebacteria bacterium]|nr:hypothetical protein [Candidatus Paceibacterota bacterium]
MNTLKKVIEFLAFWKRYVTRKELAQMMGSIAGEDSTPVGRLEIHAGMFHQKFMDEYGRKMDDKIRELEQAKAVFLENSSSRMKEMEEKFKIIAEENGRESEKRAADSEALLAKSSDALKEFVGKSENILSGFNKNFLRGVRRYARAFAKRWEEVTTQNKKTQDANIKIFRDQAEGIETMLRQRVEEETKKIGDMRSDILVLMEKAYESISIAKEIEANAIKDIRTSEAELKRANIVILYQSRENEEMRKFISAKMDIPPERIKKIFKMMCTEKYGEGVGPILEAATSIMLSNAEKQEGLSH